MPPNEPTRDELLAWDREALWHPFTQMAEYEPLVIESASGCTLVDIDGREYLDGVSSLWCNIHGHRHPKLDAAIRDQLDRIAHTTLLGASNPTTIELAHRLVQLAPEGLQHAFFSGDGSSAIEVALKMAFQYWRQSDPPRPEKSRYVALTDAYHGDTLGSVSVGGVERFHAMFRPLLFDVLRIPSPALERQAARPRDAATGAEAVEHAIATVRQLLAERHQEIAAIVIEPMVQAAAGMVMHPTGYLAALRQLTREHDVFLIADEVAVGFGRTGRMFACEHEGVSPDFLCLGKGLTGGYLPMSATLVSDKIWHAFLGTAEQSRQLYHGHTFSGNPLCAAAALASLDIFEEERVLAQLQPKIARLAKHLARLANHPHVGDIRQCGLIAGIDLVRDKAASTPFATQERVGAAVCRRARNYGVLLRPLGDILVVMPPLAISLDELDQIIEAIEKSLADVTGATI